VVGNICYTGTNAACSDRRYKRSITPITGALDGLLDIAGVYYDWKLNEFPDMGFEDKKQIGVIAQEIERYFPEVVTTDANGYKAVDYPKITPILIEAIKEQQALIDGQQQEIDELTQLRTEVAELRKMKTELAEIKALLKQKN